MAAGGPFYGWCVTNQHPLCFKTIETAKPCACECHQPGYVPPPEPKLPATEHAAFQDADSEEVMA